MLILEYHPDGDCVADVKTMEYAMGLVEKTNDPINTYRVTFSQSMILDAYRVLIKRGLVNHTLVSIRYNNWIIYAAIDGQLSDWPRGFCDHTEGYLLELL